jgi:hypothetical protein
MVEFHLQPAARSVRGTVLAHKWQETARLTLEAAAAAAACLPPPLHPPSGSQEDWIGLAQLDAAGRLDLATAPGQHMQFTLEWFETEVMWRYLASGGRGKGSGVPSWARAA